MSLEPAERRDGRTITAETLVANGGQSGHGRRTVLHLHWHPDNPLAVELLVTAEPDHPSLPRGSWIVLRDFVRYGLEEPTGDGEVRITPDEIRDRVWFQLARPGRAASVSAARPLVRDFLDRTEAQIPCGSERSDIAVDALLSMLLRKQ
ncbi:MAG TPA: SsgA family sporulation/cell division regulator [Mycobacteriales bacterium]|nr:SsgA family sporulation/cell division regulator [Mycobacteriales bacterium]